MHLQAVYRSAWRLTRHAEDAADLTQDTMLRAYRAFDTYTPGTHARAWLLRILYTVFVNHYHRKRRAPASIPIEELEARYGIELAAPPSSVEVGVGTWTEPEIAAALEELPDVFRHTVLLVDVEDLSYEEAARTLGCEVGTVRSRLFRARRLLAARLESVAQARGIGLRRGGLR